MGFMPIGTEKDACSAILLEGPQKEQDYILHAYKQTVKQLQITSCLGQTEAFHLSTGF